MKKEEKPYYTDFATEPIGGSNIYWRCVHCKESEPDINGRLEGHGEGCMYVSRKRTELLSKELEKQVSPLPAEINDAITLLILSVEDNAEEISACNTQDYYGPEEVEMRESCKYDVIVKRAQLVNLIAELIKK